MKMKNKILDVIGFILFILFFIVMIIPLAVGGAIVTPYRYFMLVSARVHNKEPKKYTF